MKLMLNGAVTLGTMDGANVEIVRQAGLENNYIFGGTVEENNAVRDTYDPEALYDSDERIRRAMDTLVDGTVPTDDDQKELFDAILKGASWHRPDNYFVLRDFESYREARLHALTDWKDRVSFGKSAFTTLPRRACSRPTARSASTRKPSGSCTEPAYKIKNVLCANWCAEDIFIFLCSFDRSFRFVRQEGGERLLHEPEIGVARYGREQHEPENAHAVKRRRGYGEEDHRQQMDHRHEKRPRQIPDAEKHRVFIVFQSVFSKVAVSGNAQMNTISHSAKQTPGSTSQNSCSGKSARRMYTSAPRRASAASRMSQSSVDFFEIIAERAEKRPRCSNAPILGSCSAPPCRAPRSKRRA